MLNDLPTEYADLSDDELSKIASDRMSLTDEAVVALDAEMQKRELTQADLTRHERFVKRSAKREAKRRLRKVFGSRDLESWADDLATLLWSALAISLVSVAYLALPPRYHFSSDWESAAKYVLFDSAFIVVASSFWWRKVAFWVLLLVSSAIHALLVHIWVVHSHGVDGRLALLLGLVLFGVLGICGLVIHRKFHGEKPLEP